MTATSIRAHSNCTQAPHFNAHTHKRHAHTLPQMRRSLGATLSVLCVCVLAIVQHTNAFNLLRYAWMHACVYVFCIYEASACHKSVQLHVLSDACRVITLCTFNMLRFCIALHQKFHYTHSKMHVKPPGCEVQCPMQIHMNNTHHTHTRTHTHTHIHTHIYAYICLPPSNAHTLQPLKPTHTHNTWHYPHTQQHSRSAPPRAQEHAAFNIQPLAASAKLSTARVSLRKSQSPTGVLGLSAGIYSVVDYK